ncbi:MAG TPA: hypothetical protein VJU86_00450 [Pyrinomonadaceae bacterium]|nr:hypothetical protein [Pyrinomonadaceae bacterium]
MLHSLRRVNSDVMLPSSHKFVIAFASLLGLVLCACEFNPRAELKGGNPPNFEISWGTGNLVTISIHEYRLNESTSSEQHIEIWRVEAARNSVGQILGRRPAEIGNVTYGLVPDGYRQTIPVSGHAPSLREATTYSYEFRTAAGMPAHGDFEIHNGVAAKVRKPHNCVITGESGTQITSPCTYYNE